MSEAVTAVQVRFPERLIHEANALVKEGWFQDLDSVLQEALRRYLDAHRSDLLDRFVREDVAWSLGGKDRPSDQRSLLQAGHRLDVAVSHPDPHDGARLPQLDPGAVATEVRESG